MTELLQRLIAELEKLLEDEQNAIATRSTNRARAIPNALLVRKTKKLMADS
ncbi:MAG: hypothetical protein KME25_30330 [Symplocastrum torsivum CPER-KK1]|jgi:hypothetical protein|uniref:Uncharacterized protein n=1 Tax=Symplocastrum torsivum CPER-KK1 TaxID=450513 RepID=A0A951UEE1_9CYAN|nr:hypothetical protein [Symplocastrum torsivum CPER-KK1]